MEAVGELLVLVGESNLALSKGRAKISAFDIRSLVWRIFGDFIRDYFLKVMVYYFWRTVIQDILP